MSQTKPISNATVLSTLGDNDKITVVTETGATGLVTSKKLKDKIDPTINRYFGAINGGHYIRIAEFQYCIDICLIVRVNLYPSRVIMATAGNRGFFVTEIKSIIGSGATAITKARFVIGRNNTHGYLDVYCTGANSAYMGVLWSHSNNAISYPFTILDTNSIPDGYTTEEIVF